MIQTDIVNLQYRQIEQQRFASTANSVKNNEKLKEACRDFEAIFIKQMLNAMKGTISKSGLMDGGFAEEIYDDMLYDEYAKKISSHAGLGIADSLYRQLTQSTKF